MGRRSGRHRPLGRIGTIALLALSAGCTGGGSTSPAPGQGNGGGGGTGGGTSGSPASWGSHVLGIVETEPADRAVQVGLSPTLRVVFDSELAVETLSFEDTRLTRVGDGSEVPLRTEVGTDGREARFEPTRPLEPATDYVLALSPLTADQDGRVLDRVATIGFRTEDSSPPAVASWDFQDPGRALGPGAWIALRFDEELAPETVLGSTIRLSGSSGQVIDADLEVDGADVRCTPHRDVAGSTDVIVSVRGIRDRSGNRMEIPWSTTVRTGADNTGPRLVSVWPDDPTVTPGPRAPARAVFDESLAGPDPDTQFVAVDALSGHSLPYKAFASRDGHTIHFLPTSDVPAGTQVEIRPNGDGIQAVDASGNSGDGMPTITFVVGSDRNAPRPLTTHPDDGSSSFARWEALRVRFDEAIDEHSIGIAASALRDDEGCLVALHAPALERGGTELVLRPSTHLEADALYTLSIPASLDGLRDRSGNPVTTSITATFRTHPNSAPPGLWSFPADGAVGVALDATIVLVCDEPIAPPTGPDAISILRPDGSAVDGRWSQGALPTTIRFSATAPWAPGAEHRVVVRAGLDGLRTREGIGWPDEITNAFRTGYRVDLDPPSAQIQLAGVTGNHAENRTFARAGFSVTVADPAQGDPGFDPAGCTLEILGPSGQVLANEIATNARATPTGLTFRIPIASPLPLGAITVRATAADLSGNRSTTAELRFDAAERTAEALPFETTQVVWVRTGLDRDGNGRADFDDDLHRLGLLAAGDPLGQNDRLRAIMIDGVLARARELFGRDRNGAPLDADPVPIRLSAREPIGVAHMQIACGGFDPEGSAGRRAGDASTGVLGRAWFDYRNATPNERNTSLDPGLGVFPAELWLFETRVHRDVYPSFVTAYAQLFLGLAPDLGGTPAGLHPRDAEALAPGFDPATGSAAASARYHAVFAAADAWATAVGTILAHEVGHSVGLTATGADAAGLHGDASLHNVAASNRDVMAAALGFDALTALAFRFRPLNDAYLRQAVMLR